MVCLTYDALCGWLGRAWSGLAPGRQVDWAAVYGGLGTMFWLSLYLLLLVPVRVPTLAVATGEDVVFDEVT